MINVDYIKEIHSLLRNNEKYKIVQTICNLEINKLKINEMNKNGITITSLDQINNYKLNKIHGRIKDTISKLNYANKIILLNDFIFKNENNKFWYEEFFSKSTYYKKRAEAVEEFLFYFLN
ncbi:Uncharacterised protein [Mycoplasmopsis maculosa]|uniref:Uncharacterized protein n=1 Tax=Mycoplasmopsis maculosa TaxID=114885 RepID=A0A449B514_9BACT|nr:hypothetical protein [Mycoplasmopsis maculosa]VEU75691.1 Uncharacterised protein [Mycoplasmopsis maculosa]